jgi:putative NADPH-quinone reductase
MSLIRRADLFVVVFPLQVAGLPDLLFQALAVVVVVGVVVLVGRVVLKIAWRLVTIAAVVIALLLGAMLFVPQVF